MRFLIQRVLEGQVAAETPGGGKAISGRIGPGLVVLVGFGSGDGPGLPGTRAWRAMIDKLLQVRIFSDDKGKMNLSLEDAGGGLLLVSQFTLYANCRRGRRPGFDDAAPPDTARALYERLVEELRGRLGERLQCGVFGAYMEVSLVNWGPVTLFWDSDELFGA